MKTNNLSGKQKKEIAAAVKKARPLGNGKVPQTAQQSIPFQQMYRDGICRTDDKHYNKTIQFFDINYQLAQNEDKTAIFEKAIKTVKRKITDLDKMKMEEQKKAFRNGYDIDIMPSDINTFGKEANSSVYLT